MIVVMAGLPGSGKSAVARQLAARLPGLILDKDAIRAGLFPPAEIEYSTQQDDFVLEIMLRLAAFYLDRDPARAILLDGRPFVRRYQVEQVARFAQQIGQPLRLIACYCPDEVARARLECSAARQDHPAANRDFALYQRLKAAQEPYGHPHLLVDTTQPLPDCVQSCLDYLSSSSNA